MSVLVRSEALSTSSHAGEVSLDLFLEFAGALVRTSDAACVGQAVMIACSRQGAPLDAAASLLTALNNERRYGA